MRITSRLNALPLNLLNLCFCLLQFKYTNVGHHVMRIYLNSITKYVSTFKVMFMR